MGDVLVVLHMSAREDKGVWYVRLNAPALGFDVDVRVDGVSSEREAVAYVDRVMVEMEMPVAAWVGAYGAPPGLGGRRVR
jgi:hypothetical protein